MCRNTAPLVKLAYKLIANGIGVHFVGRDFGKGLISLIQKLKATNLADLTEKLRAWEDRETAKALAAKNASKAESIGDRAECIRYSIEALPTNKETVSDLIAAINMIFAGAEGLLTLSTMHRAKGMEWNKVYILDRNLVPSRYAKQEWQQDQERNLMYVAVTRAKRDLVYISSKDIN